MKLYDAFLDTGFHTTIMTTFCVDFDAFESIVLSRLRGAECRNVMLVCDADMLGLALAEEDNPPKLAGTSYLVTKARSVGVFHPKLIVQIGKNRGRLIVASANATASGLAGNLELAAAIECDAKDSPERGLVLAGWQYALQFLDRRQKAVEDKLRWARDRSDWLSEEPAADAYVELADGTRAGFLSSNAATGLGTRFADLVGRGQPIERLAILSPYWDDDLAAIESLQTMLRPKKTVLLIDAERRAFPADALPRNTKIQVSDLRGFSSVHLPENLARFIHAKLFVATVGRVDHILGGSANCTIAALGTANRRGINDEACLYRRLPTGAIFDALGLTPLLKAGRAIEIGEIPEMQVHDELPLKEMKARDPGTFELVYDTLHWWPSTAAMTAAYDRGRCKLELLDAECKTLALMTEPVVHSGEERRFRIEQSGPRPAFARFRHDDGTESCLAIVARVQELQTQTRDPLTVSTERAIRELEMDDDEGLWLLDVIQTLSAPPGAKSTIASPKLSKKNKPDSAKPAAALDYNSFMQGRRREIKRSEGERHLLGGSQVSFVRAALNRLLGLKSTQEIEGAAEVSEQDAASALDTGDETADKNDALEEGFDPQDPKQSPKAALDLAKRRRAADVAAIVYAVDEYTEDLREPTRMLDEIDILRLRAMLMIIAVAGWPGPDQSSYKPSNVQVLPCHDTIQTETWPRLIGRVLAVVFSGPKPALQRLKLDASHDRLPDDLLETLACCVWSANAAAAATQANPACAKLSQILTRLAAAIGAFLKLSRDEMASPSFADVMASLDQRFGKRLQLPPLAAAFESAKSQSTRASTENKPSILAKAVPN
jgi:hypothetical protein